MEFKDLTCFKPLLSMCVAECLEFMKNLMEHRFSDRVAANVCVTIYQLGLPVGRGFIKNISRSGFYIETDFKNANLFQSLEVEVIFDRFGVVERCVYDARLVRISSSGLGLELKSMCADF